MSGQLIGNLILWLIVAIVGIAIVYWVMNWLYRRSTKEVAFVRTGFLGEKVVIDGGAFVWPIIHDITPVNMNTLQLEVIREKDDALITKDRMRVDVEAEFYVRVASTKEAVSIAASTLGRRTLEQERLHALLSGKFVSALRSTALSGSVNLNVLPFPNSLFTLILLPCSRIISCDIESPIPVPPYLRVDEASY